MNITVLGAAGSTGTLVVQQALAAGHSVTALVRSAGQMTVVDEGLRVVPGDATDAATVAAALEAADAVISTVGAPGPVIARTVEAIIAAARGANSPRVVILSSFAVLRNRLKSAAKLITALTMRAVIRDKAAGELALKASSLRWTIVHATLLNDGPARGVEVVPHPGKVGMTQRVSRADIASFLLRAATTGEFERREVLVTGA